MYCERVCIWVFIQNYGLFAVISLSLSIFIILMILPKFAGAGYKFSSHSARYGLTNKFLLTIRQLTLYQYIALFFLVNYFVIDDSTMFDI